MRSAAPRVLLDPVPPPRRHLRPSDHVLRAITSQFLALARRQNDNAEDVARALWPDDDLTLITLKAAVVPAFTSTPQWAGSLAVEGSADYWATTVRPSLFSVLRARGSLSLSLAGNAALPVPMATGQLPPAKFVGQAAPIPVVKGTVGNVTLSAKKLASIVAYSWELSNSPGSAPTILRALLDESLARGADLVMLSDDPPTPTSPGGLLAGVVPIAASANPDPSIALRQDVAGLVGALNDDASGNIVFAAARPQAVALQAALGASFAVVSTAALPVGSVVAIDAANIATAAAGAVAFDTSDTVAVHMSDTPAPIVDGGAPATPVSSMWQMALIALRVLMPADWLPRGPGYVSMVEAVAW